MAPREVDGTLPLRLVTLLTVAHVSFTGARLTLTLSAVHQHASPFAVGLLMSLLMVVPMFIAVPVGRWADRHGFFRPALLGFAMLAAASVLAAAQGGLAVLCVASVLVGSGYMTAHVAVNNAIGNASTPQIRPQAFGALAMGFSISGLAGPMLAGVAIDHLGHRATFALMVAAPLVSASLLVLPRRLPAHVSRHEAPPDRRGVLDLLRHVPLRTVFVVAGMISMGWDLFTFLVPLHGSRSGLSATAIGLLVGAFGAGSFAIRAAIPWLVRRFDEWTLLWVALALTAGCYVAFPFFTTLRALLPISFVLGMVLGCGQPLGMSLVHLTAPAGRSGEAVGLRSTITSLSQTVLPLLSGGLGTAVGMLPVFWAAAILLASGSVYASRRGESVRMLTH